MSDLFVSAPERFARLLPWLNREINSPDECLDAVMAFLREGDGRPFGAVFGCSGSDGVALSEGDYSLPARRLESIRKDVVAFLADVVEQTPARPWPLRRWRLSLSMAAHSTYRQRPQAPAPNQSLPRLTANERRDYFGGDAYLVSISGSLRDVLLYAVARMLTEPGAVALARCPAPSVKSGEPCGRWFVTTGQRRGRPAIYCSGACRLRAFKAKKEK